MYGTPSFWNWLSESEEEVYPTASPPTVAPKVRHHQKAAAHPNNKYIASPTPSPLGPPLQLEEITEPTPQQLEIERLPEPAPFVQSEPSTEQFEEPISDPVEVETISPFQLEPIGPSQWEPFVPVTQPTPVIAAHSQPPAPIPNDPDAIMMSQGFTRDYRNHYFSWVNDAVHPGSNMAPELSWADLGPNGPLMADPNSQQSVVEQPTRQQPAPVDRRRKAKPEAQHTQKSSIDVQRQPTSSRPATILVPAPQQPVFHSKPAPVKKQITSAPKHEARQAPTKFSKSKSVPHPQPKSVSSPKVFTTIPIPIVAPTPASKSKSNKTKPKQKSTTVTTKTTTNGPVANEKYSNDDNEDVAYYDDNSDYRPT